MLRKGYRVSLLIFIKTLKGQKIFKGARCLYLVVTAVLYFDYKKPYNNFYCFTGISYGVESGGDGLNSI